MKYRATVLTPTLVGDGSRLSPIDYMVWRDQVNVLNQTRIFKLLSKGPRLDGYLKQLQNATKLDFASWGGFAQNYADRRIPFEDAGYAPFFNSAPPESLSIPTFSANNSGPFLPGSAIKGALRTAVVFSRVKPAAVHALAEKLAGDRLPRRPAEDLERQTVGSGGSDRMRAVVVADSEALTRETFKVYLLRLSTLIAKGPDQYSLGWKQTGRGAVDGKRPDDSTPTFAEMAAPGTAFEGAWRENDFLNREEVRQLLRWNQPVTHKTLFEAANQYAAKQLELHAQYAQWTGLEGLAGSIAGLQQKLDEVRNNGACLLAIGWGAGFLSKSAAIGADESDQRKVLAMLPFYNRAIQTGLPFPKTRRVVFLKNKPAALPGWVELRVV
jgi:CRISPR-associated protein Csm5